MERQFFVSFLFLMALALTSHANAAHLIAGSEDAKVQILIWGDFQCYPTKFQIDNIPQLRADYGNQIGVMFGQFPLEGHPEALPAAIAAQCAEDQGKFVPFLEEAFANQNDLGRKFFMDTASKIGVSDISAFKSCLDSSYSLQRVRLERSAGMALGVFGTPFTYINGELFKGGMLYPDLKAAIDKALAHANK